MAYQTTPPTGFTVDQHNTSSVALGAGATFTGIATDISRINQINIIAFASPATAKGSLFLEFSQDGISWLISIPSVVRNPTLVIPIPLIPVAKFFRLRYLNDGGAASIAALGLTETATAPVAQTILTISAQTSFFATKELVRTLDQLVQGSDPAILTRGVIVEENTPGLYTNVRSSSKLWYHNANVNETRNLKAGPGSLKRVIINDATAGSITFYDSLTAAGAIIAVIQTTANGNVFLVYELDFTIGLTYVSAATPGDFTVTWR